MGEGTKCQLVDLSSPTGSFPFRCLFKAQKDNLSINPNWCSQAVLQQPTTKTLLMDSSSCHAAGGGKTWLPAPPPRSCCSSEHPSSPFPFPQLKPQAWDSPSPLFPSSHPDLLTGPRPSPPSSPTWVSAFPGQDHAGGQQHPLPSSSHFIAEPL